MTARIISLRRREEEGVAGIPLFAFGQEDEVFRDSRKMD
jgi:hypothetical protein